MKQTAPLAKILIIWERTNSRTLLPVSKDSPSMNTIPHGTWQTYIWVDFLVNDTRVKLNQLPDDPYSDYVNACYIDVSILGQLWGSSDVSPASISIEVQPSLYALFPWAVMTSQELHANPVYSFCSQILHLSHTFGIIYRVTQYRTILSHHKVSNIHGVAH